VSALPSYRQISRNAKAGVERELLDLIVSELFSGSRSGPFGNKRSFAGGFPAEFSSSEGNAAALEEVH
jgi:hypothetical protein